jgi:hypothetical protein
MPHSPPHNLNGCSYSLLVALLGTLVLIGLPGLPALAITQLPLQLLGLEPRLSKGAILLSSQFATVVCSALYSPALWLCHWFGPYRRAVTPYVSAVAVSYVLGAPITLAFQIYCAMNAVGSNTW